MSVAQLESREIQIEAPSGLWREAWHRLIRNPAALAGFALVALFVGVAVFAPLLAPYSPRDTVAPLTDSLQAPTWHHVAGLDEQARDEFSRVIFGARFSLAIGLAAAGRRLSPGLRPRALPRQHRRLLDPVDHPLLDIMN